MEVFVKIISLKKMSVPKVAVLATGLAAALLAATVNPAPVAQAFPTKAANCAGCHAVGGSTTAAPSTLTPAAGASYTVAITLAANPAGGNSGYAIVPVAPAVEKTNGGNTSSALSYTATMTAPAAAGTYTYNVYTNQGLTDPAGQASGTSYTITVAPVVTVPPTTVPPKTVPPTTVPPTTVPPTTVPPTTVPPTTVPPTTVPPTTVPPTTVPPTTVPPTTVPPTTVPPTTVPPTTVPPTTVPPTTVPPTTVPPTTVPPTTVPPTTVPPVLTPPTSTTSVLSLSPNHGKVGTKVTIRGNGFGKAGLVKFGAGKAKVVSWTRTSIVVKVPSTYIVKVESESRTFSAEPVWYRHDPSSVLLTVTPQGASVSNAVGFRVDSQKDDHGRGDNHNR
jgi:cytochrome c553